jgi:hypothetical protein
METMTPECLALLLKRAGLEPNEREIERLKPVFEQYMRALDVLHSIDLGDEEAAPAFDPRSGVE